MQGNEIGKMPNRSSRQLQVSRVNLFQKPLIGYSPGLFYYCDPIYCFSALEPPTLEVYMSVHGFVKMIEFWLLKFQENGKNKQQQQEIQRVSKH